MKDKVINIIKIVLLIIVVIIVAILVKKIINHEEIPFISDKKIYIVMSGSMEPNVEPGDIVISKRVKKEDISVGDIITFDTGMTVTHRVVEINEVNGITEYTTKGDNNNTNDLDKITYNNVIGKLSVRIPKLGYLVLLIRNNLVLFTVIVAFIIIFIITRPEKQKKEKDNSKKNEDEKLNSSQKSNTEVEQEKQKIQ